MVDSVLLNENPYHLELQDLPSLVTYRDREWGSHFTISLVADLFLRGHKILFITAYPMAKDNFMKQTLGYHNKISYVTEHSQFSLDDQCIIIESGNEALWIEAMKSLGDINERIILIKNIETFSSEIFDHCVLKKYLILSWNIDSCIAKGRIMWLELGTIFAFSKPTKVDIDFEIPYLEKYTGYLHSSTKKWLVKLFIEE